MNEPTKFLKEGSFEHLVEVSHFDKALLTLHNDGTITVAEGLKPTETAAEVLRIMRDMWMDDAQSIKIRDQQERIKRLEEAGDEMALYASPYDSGAWNTAKEVK